MSEKNLPIKYSGIFMDDLVTALDQYANGTAVIVEWNNGARTLCNIETIYESDNDLDMDDVNYEEYFMCVLKVKKNLTESEDCIDEVVGSLLDVCVKSPITRIVLENETLIWERS